MHEEKEKPEYKNISCATYGGYSPYVKGTSNNPLWAVQYKCCAKECSLRASGKCVLCVGNLMDSAWCPFGKGERIKGYTFRAKKYYDFRDKWESKPDYRALKEAQKTFVAEADGIVLFRLRGLSVFPVDDGIPDPGAKLSYSNRGSCLSTVAKEDFTLEFVNSLLTEKHGERGSKRFKTEIAPMFLQALRKYDEEFYVKLLIFYPEIQKFEFDPVGKKAKLSTLADGVDIRIDKQTYVKHGQKLVCENFEAKDFIHTFATGRIELDINPDYVIKIEKADWVDEDTIYID